MQLYEEMSGSDETRRALVKRFAGLAQADRADLYSQAREALDVAYQELRGGARYVAGLQRAADAGGLNAAGRSRAAADGLDELRTQRGRYDRAARTKTALSIVIGYGAGDVRTRDYAAAKRTEAGVEVVDAVIVLAIDLRRLEI